MHLLFILLLLSCLSYSEILLPDNFSSDFTQTITNPKNKVIHYSGKVQFSADNLLKWRYLKPTKKEVCTNGTNLLVVDHDLEQVSAYYITKGLDISKVLHKAKLHAKNIYVAEYEGQKYTIQLDKNQKLQSIAYFDALDNKVQILFKGMKYGKGKLPSKKTRCDYPVEYDVIEG